MNIAEIFTSIQGEGSYSGYPTFFVRLSGCNLHCTYCDTPSAQKDTGRTTEPLSLAEEILHSGMTHVCITGGEPLLQLDELLVLLRPLHDSGKIVCIETNGTVDFRSLQAFSTICMDVKCPSSGEVSELSLLSSIRDVDSVKFVIGSDEDLTYAHTVLREIPISGTIFWSPVYGMDPHLLISYMIEMKLPVRFQLQLHKVVGVQ